MYSKIQTLSIEIYRQRENTHKQHTEYSLFSTYLVYVHSFLFLVLCHFKVLIFMIRNGFETMFQKNNATVTYMYYDNIYLYSIKYLYANIDYIKSLKFFYCRFCAKYLPDM